MIDRYEDVDIVRIFSLANKGQMWQKVELAVTRALENLGLASSGTHAQMAERLSAPIDVALWLELEKVNHHDFNAWQEERMRFLPVELHQYFHPDTTSYDTEEPAFTLMLREALEVVKPKITAVEDALIVLARRYRFTPMYARSHGQGAKMITFGKRCVSHLKELRLARDEIMRAAQILRYSKISGAAGNYGGRLTPQIEKEALAVLGLEPLYGVTQIVPRVLFVPFGTALAALVQVLHDIAIDVRLAARSGNPIYQEPFGKKQKGSAAMPHKQNPIADEQTEGMARLAASYAGAILRNIPTMEERSIEQSSVERVVWPDLLHVTYQALKTMARVLKGLRVNPDHMMNELYEARGCYASDEAKGELRQLGAPYGLSGEDAYRIVQLAAFNVHEPSEEARELRDSPPPCYPAEVCRIEPTSYDSIEFVIKDGRLVPSGQLEVTPAQIEAWNQLLRQLFQDQSVRRRWHEIFTPPFLLQQEAILYREILGES